MSNLNPRDSSPAYPALLSYSRVDGELWRRLDPRSGPTFATIHGHMIYGGWQDSRLVLSILTSISRGYELDSWAFPGLILYGGWIDWWPDIYILSSSTRDRSISRSEYSRGCLHWISLSRGFSRTLTRNLLVSPYVPGLILYGDCQDSWLEIWILSSSRRGNTARNQN